MSEKRLPENQNEPVPAGQTADLPKGRGLSPGEKRKKKRKMLIGVITVCVLGAASWVLVQNPQLFDSAKPSTPVNMYSDQLVSYQFYPADYTLDITQDAEYMGLDRQIYYRQGSETMVMEDGDLNRFGAGAAFFVDYFAAVIGGDAETYNTYFTDHYYESNQPYESFPPQMLYDILIEQLSSTSNEDGTVTYAFNVSYKIHKNTGTFRNDLDSDASKPLYFELIEDAEGTVKIDRITYYVR